MKMKPSCKANIIGYTQVNYMSVGDIIPRFRFCPIFIDNLVVFYA